MNKQSINLILYSLINTCEVFFIPLLEVGNESWESLNDLSKVTQLCVTEVEFKILVRLALHYSNKKC